MSTDDLRSAAAALGRAGGLRRSPAKIRTAQENGKLGGWVAPGADAVRFCLAYVRLDMAQAKRDMASQGIKATARAYVDRLREASPERSALVTHRAMHEALRRVRDGVD